MPKTDAGRWRWSTPSRATFAPIDLPLEPIESIRANERAIYFVGGSATEPLAIVRVPLDSLNAEVLRSSVG